MRRWAKDRAPALVISAVMLLSMINAVVTVFLVGDTSTVARKIDRPTVKEDRRAAGRRLDRLTGAQLLELARRIAAAQHEHRARVAARAGTVAQRSAGTPRDSGRTRRPTPTSGPAASPAPVRTPTPSGGLGSPPARTPTPRPTPRPVRTPPATSPAPTAAPASTVAGVQIPLLPLVLCTALVTLNCR